jgi:hypothetical protein
VLETVCYFKLAKEKKDNKEKPKTIPFSKQIERSKLQHTEFLAILDHQDKILEACKKYTDSSDDEVKQVWLFISDCQC